MSIHIAAIGVGHWHSLFDAAYLKTLARMPEVQLVGIHDPDAAMAAQRAAQLGKPPTFTDYREMLAKTRPDFVIALGRHADMAATAHFLLDAGYPFLIEKQYFAPRRYGRVDTDGGTLRRVFDIDIERCPQCGGNLKSIAAVEEPAVIERMRTHLGLCAQPPPRTRATLGKTAELA